MTNMVRYSQIRNHCRGGVTKEEADRYVADFQKELIARGKLFPQRVVVPLGETSRFSTPMPSLSVAPSPSPSIAPTHSNHVPSDMDIPEPFEGDDSIVEATQDKRKRRREDEGENAQTPKTVNRDRFVVSILSCWSIFVLL
jgi:hypothetical protein